MWFSIKNKARVLVLLLVFIPMIMTGLFLITLFQEAILEQFRNEQTNILRSIQRNRIDSTIEILERMLIEYEGDHRFAEVFVDSEETAALRKEWDTFSRILSWNTWIYFCSEQNQFLSSRDFPDSVYHDFTKTLWYSQGRDETDINWTVPYRSEKNSEIILTATLGIRDPKGVFLGVLGIDIQMKAFFTSFKHEALEKNARILAVLDNDTVINFNRKANEPIEYGSLYQWQDLIDAPKGRQLIQLNGTGFFAFSVYLDRLDIALVSLIPESLMKEELQSVMLLIIGVICLCTLFMMIGAYRISVSIIRNIENLNSYMSDVAGGQYQLQNCVKGKDELGVLNTYLNHMVETLSNNINRLEEMNDQKERLINVRTTLIHIISHNASTPITILFNNSMELLEEKEACDEYRQMFQAAGNLKNLMENTMIYLKLEEGIADSQAQLVNLQEITGITCRMYQFQARNKQLRLETEMPGELFIEGNYFLIKTVLENLVDNAVKYSRPGGTIFIRGWYGESHLYWSIRDNGPGFTPRDRELLFGKFQKLSARPTGSESSTGLGLFLVKKLMTLFNGKINLDDAAGEKGACFTLSFPFEAELPPPQGTDTANHS